MRSYQNFRETCCLRVHKNIMKAAGYSETLVATAEIFFFRWFQAGRSQWLALAGTAGSEPGWGMDVCLL
jgi:hypothetical protein